MLRLRGLAVYCLRSVASGYRMGIVVSRRMGCAVERNKFKRRVRNLFGSIVTLLPNPCDILVVAKHPSVVQMQFADLKKSLEDGFYKLAE